MHVCRSMLNEISKMTSIKKQSRIKYYKIILQTSVEAETASSYDQDTEWEGQAADCMIPIKKGKLDIATIKAWWMQFKDKSNYHLLGNNCCSVIYEALKRGGATKYASFPWNPISTPANLKDYALELKQATQ